MRSATRTLTLMGVLIASFGAIPLTDAQGEALPKAMFGRGHQVLVAPGDEQRAIAYYRDVVTKETGFQTEPRPSLDELLGYFGYALKGEDLEADESDEIMKRFPAGEVLVSRYFAPKITDVSSSASPPAYGWRKLLRLRAQANSGAANRGLKNMYLLFNFFNNNLDISPFRKADGTVNHSVNNQVLLVRSPASPLPKPAYFMTFGPYGSVDLAERGRLITYLDATFDAGDPNLPTIRRYYVPVACTACHGGGRIKVNYLDSDHWFDRVNNDDFDAVGKKQPLLFDSATNDSTKPEFKKAFDIVRRLNAEVLDQNKDADANTVSFQQSAVESWLRSHATTEAHISIFNRSITASGPATWSEANPIDKELLPLLNRYCYRCHSSVKYHIYDKSAVIDRSGDMIDRIRENPTGTPQYFMPQDRALADPDRSRLLDLLGRLE